MFEDLWVRLLWVAKIYGFIYKFVDEHEIRAQVLFFKRTAKVMNSTDNAPKKLKCKWGDNFAASRGEDEKKLVSLDVRKLDTLSLKKWFLLAFLIFGERVCYAHLG